MNFKCILWILLLFINHVVGEFLQMSFSSVNMSRVIRSISGITITGCHMECGKEPACHDIAITERTPDNHLPTCYLLKEDNGHYDEGGNVLTTIKVKFHLNFTVICSLVSAFYKSYSFFHIWSLYRML